MHTPRGMLSFLFTRCLWISSSRCYMYLGFLDVPSKNDHVEHTASLMKDVKLELAFFQTISM